MSKYSIFFVVALGSLSSAFGQSALSVERPAFVAGDTWTYRTLDWNVEKRRSKLVVSGVVADVLQLESTPAQITGAANTGTTLKFAASLEKWDFFDAKITSGARENIRYPLSLGDKWKYEYSISRSDGGTMLLQYEATADSWEDVSVPAGTFRALKIVHAGRYTMQGGSSTVRETFWYAPSVKNFVKWEHQSRGFSGGPFDNFQRELTEFKVQ
jgi:hypothetical protein